MSYLELSILLFLQLTVILATCRVVGWLGRRFLGQTQVVMEMVAGSCSALRSSVSSPRRPRRGCSRRRWW